MTKRASIDMLTLSCHAGAMSWDRLSSLPPLRVLRPLRLAGQRLHQYSLALVNLVLPPRCPVTGTIVDAPGMLDPACWQGLTFISAPHCNGCGMPFSVQAATQAQDILCGDCLAHPFDFDRARAAVVYNDTSRTLILGFKYGDKLHAVTTFLPWLLRAASPLLAQVDLIVPVPLHRRRLWQRRFNQSALLAQALARASGTPCHPMLLRRTRPTRPQKGLSRKARRDNVAQAFAVTPGKEAYLTGKRILLIDDVFTSGATLDACSKALRRAGAAGVDVVTLARVTREDVF